MEKCWYFIQKRNFKHEKIMASIKKSNFEFKFDAVRKIYKR